MTMIIFLFLVVLLVSGIAWNLKKSREKAEKARQKSRELLQQHQKEAMTQDYEMIWPVVIRPVTGGEAGAKDSDHGDPDAGLAEPTMTAVEYTPPQKKSG